MQQPPQKIIQLTQDLIQKDLSLDFKSTHYSEEELLDILADYVFHYMQNNLEQLFSILYRLDVDERKVHAALAPEATAAANLAIAQLILERQKQKVESRLRYQNNDLDEESTTW